MDYHLEFLTEDRFQKLCQALLVAELPGVQCLPTNQPDGGRDAFRRRRAAGGFAQHVAFQVKFVRNPSSKTARDEILDVGRSEKSKVDRLKQLGLQQYYLMTNVSGTSHLDSGSIDKLNAELSAILGIESYCWWRDDLERRLDANSSIRWSYPEVLTGTDLVGLLVPRTETSSRARIKSAIEAYLAGQYVQDEEVKFKQIQLQNKLLDLITDVPVGVIKDRNDAVNMEYLAPMFGDRHVYYSGAAYEYEGAICAAELLLSQDFSDLAPFSVLEGAPGQGKSTVTQYLAQVHRMRLLGKADDLRRIPDSHARSKVRLPIRVDLRDLASWLDGRSPFASSFNEPLSADVTRSLEAFLVQHIREGSGGRTFELEDLVTIAAESHVLVILDGFDEVAEADTRERLVREVSVASARLKNVCLSFQVIVTSRPAAFANSPGFSTKEWPHFELKALTRQQVQDYSEKWMSARGLLHSEKVDFRRVLSSRLEQDHIRQLARNPMQLSILLTLINTKGLSLPDKRTALYDSYIDLFFGREAEKSEVVREQRDLLISLHRYLAWVLQCEAEAGRGAGSIEDDRLKSILRAYLRENLHDELLIDILFRGMVERVVALVSRVQGTFEFEVQPLREYFAARYLYETAPYSPPGAEHKGTKPEIFISIAENPYWLNVTRFYAGCYSSGELASLVDALQHLNDAAVLRLASHPRQLAVMLLGDWVFSQQPRTVAKVIDFVVSEPGFKVYMASRIRLGSDETFTLPSRSGRQQLIDWIVPRISSGETPSDYALSLARVLRQNLSEDDAFNAAMGLRDTVAPTSWPGLALALGVGRRCLEVLLREDHLDVGAALTLARSFEDPRDYVRDSRMYAAAAHSILSAENVGIYFHDDDPNFPENVRHLVALRHALSLWTYANVVSHDKGMVFGELIRRYFYSVRHDQREIPCAEVDPDTRRGCADVAQAFNDLRELTVGGLKSSTKWIGSVIEAARAHWGETRALTELACYAAALPGLRERGAWPSSLSDRSVPLASAARFAYLRAGDADWWNHQLDRFDNTDFALTCLLSWGSADVLSALGARLEELLARKSEQEWSEFFASLDRLATALGSSGSARRSLPTTVANPKWHRLNAVLSTRIDDKSSAEFFERIVSGYKGADKVVLGVFARLSASLLYRSSKGHAEKLRVIGAAYSLGVFQEPVEFVSQREKSRMTTATVAAEICASAESYPLFLTAWAERSLRVKLAKQISRVGDVAKRQGWAAAALH